MSVVTLLLWPTPTQAQGRPIALAVTRADMSALRVVDQQVDQLLRSGDLRMRESVLDSLVPDRTHQRLDQYVRGVRIVGGDITRQTAADGTVSIFGMMHDASAVSTTPALNVDAARTAIANVVAGQLIGDAPELVLLPLSDGDHLAYFGRARVGFDLVNVFVDANDASLLQRYSEYISDVGVGVGAYGDQ